MRVVLWADMEGMSRITDHRECWPAFSDYWRLGRRAFTDEVVAATSGLLEGGATEVYVVNGHCLGWPNLIWQDLPDGARPADDRAWAEGVDAMFQVGFHARAGTPDAFMSHTMAPGLKAAVDGNPITESHIWAWLVGIPVLGVVGDAALEAQLDGIITGTPFLAAKHSVTRGTAKPAHRAGGDSMTAIRDFARQCVSTARSPTLTTPDHFTFAVAMDPQLADHAEGQRGLVRHSPSVLTVAASDWGHDVQPALQAAMGAALRPLLAAQGELDLSTEEAMQSQEPRRLALLRRYFIDWSEASDSDWPPEVSRPAE